MEFWNFYQNSHFNEHLRTSAFVITEAHLEPSQASKLELLQND